MNTKKKSIDIPIVLIIVIVMVTGLIIANKKTVNTYNKGLKTEKTNGSISVDDTNSYETLEEAMEAVSDGGTIKLESDITVTEEINYSCTSSSESKAFTIDLNGHTITNTGEYNNINNRAVIYIQAVDRDKDITITSTTGKGKIIGNKVDALYLVGSEGSYVQDYYINNIILESTERYGINAWFGLVYFKDCKINAVNFSAIKGYNALISIESTDITNENGDGIYSEGRIIEMRGNSQIKAGQNGIYRVPKGENADIIIEDGMIEAGNYGIITIRTRWKYYNEVR